MLITSIHCLYTGNTCTYNVNTCQIQGMYMFYNLHTVCKHHIYIIYMPLVRLSQSGTHIYNASYHIYNASCQESSILYIDCLDLTHTCRNWLYAIISILIIPCTYSFRWSPFYGFSQNELKTCTYTV